MCCYNGRLVKFPDWIPQIIFFHLFSQFDNLSVNTVTPVTNLRYFANNSKPPHPIWSENTCSSTSASIQPSGACHFSTSKHEKHKREDRNSTRLNSSH